MKMVVNVNGLLVIALTTTIGAIIGGKGPLIGLAVGLVIVLVVNIAALRGY